MVVDVVTKRVVGTVTPSRPAYALDVSADGQWTIVTNGYRNAHPPIDVPSTARLLATLTVPAPPITHASR